MTQRIGFMPTTNIPRAHTALTRLWRCELGRRRLDAIYCSFLKTAYAYALGWDEMGPIEEVRPGWTNAETFADCSGPCDVIVLRAGDEAYYANCQRAAARIGSPSWVGWQDGLARCQPLSESTLVSELTPGEPPSYNGHGTPDEFWRTVDREKRFVWIIRLDAVGDLLLTLSYLRTFKKRFPHRRIGMIVRDRHVSWLKDVEWLDGLSGVDIFYWERLEHEAPAGNGKSAWLNLMPGMLRVAGNRLLASRSGPKISAYPDAATPCEFSLQRHIVSQRELFAAVFAGVEPELAVERSRKPARMAIWFSPYPGVDERLWPPNSWTKALQPLKGRHVILQPAHSAPEKRWELEFLRRAGAAGLKIERSRPTRTIFDLAKEMSEVSGWVGVNSAPMHVAAMLGLPSLAIGAPWERNAMWHHPGLQIIAAEEYATSLLETPTTRKLQAFARETDRSDEWADGLYLRPEEFADTLRSHPLMKRPA